MDKSPPLHTEQCFQGPPEEGATNPRATPSQSFYSRGWDAAADARRWPPVVRLLEWLLLGLCVALLSACAHRTVGKQEPAVSAAGAGIPYAGFAVGENPAGGAVVIDTIAGPAALAGLLPGDRIDAVAGKPVGAARLLEIIRSSTPGTRLPLRVIRDTQVLKLDLVVGDRETWASPSSWPSRVSYVDAGARTEVVWLDEVNARVASAAPALAPVNDRVDRMFGELARNGMGYNRLSLNRLALADPGVLIAREHRLVQNMDPAGEVRSQVMPMLCEVLALDCGMLAHDSPDGAGTRLLAEFSGSIAVANRRVQAAFAEAGPRAALLADLRYLLEQTAENRTLLDRPQAIRGIRAMQMSRRVNTAALLEAFGLLIDNAARPPVVPAAGRREPPKALAALVTGDILDYEEVDGGYVVMGGPGPNRYRMERLFAVIDTGGDDRYVWGEDEPLQTQTVIDLQGNDSYEARIGGPGAGWLGAAVLIDMAGDDRYASSLGGCGAGAFGFGLLYDAAGADTYRCDAWSAGAGIYGGGVLIDAGDGWDAYLSQSLSQGVGGPGGAGVLVDAGGEDLYRANGPVPSAYDTPAVFMSFSQGVGFGIRPYDHGGFGALLDFGGNDRYEGGEFSQGGGYFWGVGLLHDASGNDLYYGNRYAQGFAVHQAAGLFSDMAGDDVYWALRAAAQGAAWDQSVAMMFDGSGNDVYRAESLAQGAAAQQSKAWLFDAGGNDSYWSSVDSAQGAATDNSYHFKADDPILSLGVVLDAAGEDRYSTGLANGDVRIRHAPDNPDNGNGNAGIAIDESR